MTCSALYLIIENHGTTVDMLLYVNLYANARGHKWAFKIMRVQAAVY